MLIGEEYIFKKIDIKKIIEKIETISVRGQNMKNGSCDL